MAESHHIEDEDTPDGHSEDETSSGTRQKLRGIVNRFSGLKPNWNMKPKLSLRWPKMAEKETRVLVHVINVGQGDAFLVEYQEEPGMLARVIGKGRFVCVCVCVCCCVKVSRCQGVIQAYKL